MKTFIKCINFFRMELDSKGGVREVDVVQDKNNAGQCLPPTA